MILETAKKFLEKNQPEHSLERLKRILYEKNFSEEWKIHELIGVCFHDLADAEGVVQSYFNAAKTDKILRSQRTHFSNYIFALHYLNVDEKILSDAAKIYNSLYRDTKEFPKKSIARKKIHVAFIASHFLDSSAARFFEILLTDYNKEKFFVSAWSLSDREDNFTKKIRQSVDKFFSFGEINFYKIAEKIFVENVEILIDFSGHTDGGETLQILAYKPAKTQISCIGYFDTTGMSSIDYFLTDEFLISGCQNFFSENILTIENAFAFKPSENMIFAKKSLKKTRHKNFTFGCMNNFMKITDEYLHCVKKILNEVPNSKIIFRDTTPLLSRKKSLEKKILSVGIKNFEVRVGSDDFFADYSEIDLNLDTFPYNGGMMTALSIYFDVPVLNLIGDKHFSRIGADILRISGAEDFITENVDDYVKQAVELSKKPLRKNFSDKLFDTENFLKDFYEKISDLR